MIAVCFENSLSFTVEPFIDRFAISKGCGGVGPRCDFYLVIEPQFVGCDKCRLGWTPGMEADQIEPMLLRDPNDSAPRFDVRGRMTRFWKDAAFEGSANKCLAIINEELRSLSADLSHAKRDDFFVSR